VLKPVVRYATRYPPRRSAAAVKNCHWHKRGARGDFQAESLKLIEPEATPQKKAQTNNLFLAGNLSKNGIQIKHTFNKFHDKNHSL